MIRMLRSNEPLVAALLKVLPTADIVKWGRQGQATRKPLQFLGLIGRV